MSARHRVQMGSSRPDATKRAVAPAQEPTRDVTTSMLVFPGRCDRGTRALLPAFARRRMKRVGRETQGKNSRIYCVAAVFVVPSSRPGPILLFLLPVLVPHHHTIIHRLHLVPFALVTAGAPVRSASPRSPSPPLLQLPTFSRRPPPPGARSRCSSGSQKRSLEGRLSSRHRCSGLFAVSPLSGHPTSCTMGAEPARGPGEALRSSAWAWHGQKPQRCASSSP